MRYHSTSTNSIHVIHRATARAAYLLCVSSPNGISASACTDSTTTTHRSTLLVRRSMLHRSLVLVVYVATLHHELLRCSE